MALLSPSVFMLKVKIKRALYIIDGRVHAGVSDAQFMDVAIVQLSKELNGKYELEISLKILNHPKLEEKKRCIIIPVLNCKHRLIFKPGDDSFIILSLEVIGTKLRVSNLALLISQPPLI